MNQREVIKIKEDFLFFNTKIGHVNKKSVINLGTINASTKGYSNKSSLSFALKTKSDKEYKKILFNIFNLKVKNRRFLWMKKV